MKVYAVIRYGYDEHYEILHLFNTRDKAEAKLKDVIKTATKENKHKPEYMVVNQFDTLSFNVE